MFNPRILVRDIATLYKSQLLREEVVRLPLVHQDTPLVVISDKPLIEELLAWLIKQSSKLLLSNAINIIIGWHSSDQCSYLTILVHGKVNETEFRNAMGLSKDVVEKLTDAGGSLDFTPDQTPNSPILSIRIPATLPPNLEPNVHNSSLTGKSILALLTDDESQQMRRYLAAWKIQLEIADNPPQFIARLIARANHAKNYHMVIVEENLLKGLTANDFLEMIHAEHQLSQLRYVLLVSPKNKYSEHEYINAGYAAVLTKPYNKTALYNILHTAFEMPSYNKKVISMKYQRLALVQYAAKILVIEKQEELCPQLQEQGVHADSLACTENLLVQLQNNNYACVLIKDSLLDQTIPQIVAELDKTNTPVLVITSDKTVEIGQRKDLVRIVSPSLSTEGLLQSLDKLILFASNVEKQNATTIYVDTQKLLAMAEQNNSVALLKNEIQQFIKTTSEALDILIVAANKGEYKKMKVALELLIEYATVMHATELELYVTELVNLPTREFTETTFQLNINTLSAVLYETYKALTRTANNT